MKNQQLINLHRTGIHIPTPLCGERWFSLHVSQNKLSWGTPLCDINFISAIKRNHFVRSERIKSFHLSLLCRRDKNVQYTGRRELVGKKMEKYFV